MYQIQSITSAPQQEFVLAVPDSSETAQLTLTYCSNTQSWQMGLTYGETVITGRRVCSSPNLLRAWKNVFPFGLACYALDGSDPYYLEDFQNGRCGLLILSAAEVANLEAYLGELKDET